MDTLTRAQRSEVMHEFGAKIPDPRIVRRLVYALGFRYRLNVAKIPGKPDLVFSSRRSLIFVHGCFWHRHPRLALARMPKSRLKFWREKLDGNRHGIYASNVRSAPGMEALRGLGMRAGGRGEVTIEIALFLEGTGHERH